MFNPCLSEFNPCFSEFDPCLSEFDPCIDQMPTRRVSKNARKPRRQMEETEKHIEYITCSTSIIKCSYCDNFVSLATMESHARTCYADVSSGQSSISQVQLSKKEGTHRKLNDHSDYFVHQWLTRIDPRFGKRYGDRFAQDGFETEADLQELDFKYLKEICARYYCL